MEIIIYICIIIGLFVNAMSVVGLFRFPDIYTRLHAATKTTTFGSIFIVAAVIIESLIHYDQVNLTIIFHSAIALLVIIFTNPISAHAIARAAMLCGIKPYGVKINEFKIKEKEIKDNMQ
jgi:multicomponent Na+:H+ antiporter subunit G